MIMRWSYVGLPLGRKQSREKRNVGTETQRDGFLRRNGGGKRGRRRGVVKKSGEEEWCQVKTD
jgi:hypothetical protein